MSIDDYPEDGAEGIVTCAECGCDLECDEHDFDCSYGSDEAQDEDEE